MRQWRLSQDWLDYLLRLNFDSFSSILAPEKCGNFQIWAAMICLLDAARPYRLAGRNALLCSKKTVIKWHEFVELNIVVENRTKLLSIIMLVEIVQIATLYK